MLLFLLFLYTLSADTGAIVKIDESTGAVEREYLPKSYPYESLAVHDNFIYASTREGIIYKIRLDDGEILGSIIAPLAGFNRLATDGVSLWYVSGGSIYQLNIKDGKKLAQFAAPDSSCKKLEFRDGSLWYTAGDDKVHQLAVVDPSKENSPREGGPAPASFAPVPGLPTP